MTLTPVTDRNELPERMGEIRNEIAALVAEARDICVRSEVIAMGNADGYVFDHLNELIENSNQYDQSLLSLEMEMEISLDDEEDE